MTSTAKAETKPHYEFIKKHPHMGDLMLEHIVNDNGKVTTKTVLVIPYRSQPGVWHDGIRRPRKQMIYDCVSEPPLHPRDDVRSRR